MRDHTASELQRRDLSLSVLLQSLVTTRMISQLHVQVGDDVRIGYRTKNSEGTGGRSEMPKIRNPGSW